MNTNADTTPSITEAQLKKLHVSLHKAGLGGDRQLRLNWLGWAVGRTVTSSKELSKREASVTIDLLEKFEKLEAASVDSPQSLRRPYADSVQTLRRDVAAETP
jgi:hypothetical protein